MDRTICHPRRAHLLWTSKSKLTFPPSSWRPVATTRTRAGTRAAGGLRIGVLSRSGSNYLSVGAESIPGFRPQGANGVTTVIYSMGVRASGTSTDGRTR